MYDTRNVSVIGAQQQEVLEPHSRRWAVTAAIGKGIKHPTRDCGIVLTIQVMLVLSIQVGRAFLGSVPFDRRLYAIYIVGHCEVVRRVLGLDPLVLGDMDGGLKCAKLSQ